MQQGSIWVYSKLYNLELEAPDTVVEYDDVGMKMELPVHFSAVAPLYDDGADFFNDWDGRVTRVSARFTTRKDLLSDLCQRVPFTTLPRKMSSKATELETESILRFQHART